MQINLFWDPPQRLSYLLLKHYHSMEYPKDDINDNKLEKFASFVSHLK